MQFEINRLSSLDAEDYRNLRLDGLASDPEAFGTSWEEEASLSIDDFARRLDRGNVFGARQTNTLALMGTVGLRVS